MIIYVIHKQQLFSLSLPLKINGSYSITDIDKENKERNLINISEENGKWVAFSNKQVKILENNQEKEQVVLDYYQYLYLKLKGEDEYLIMYTCPINDTSKIELIINKEAEFLIGSDKNCAISCNNPFISLNNTKIKYEKNTWYLQDLNSKYGTFVNNKLVKGPVKLFHGDVIFIMGLKIIFIGNKVILNNPLNSVKVVSNLFIMAPLKAKNPSIDYEDETEIKLYDESEYFIRSPRFMEIIETKDFKVESPPNTEPKEEQPLLLIIGPMLTMGSTSIVMLIVTFISYKNGNSNILNILPMMAMSISMLAGTLLWPSLSRSFQKKQHKIKNAKIEKKYNEYLERKEKELLELEVFQKQILLSNNISSMECYRMIINKNRSLWMRELGQNDFLSLRLGVGNVPLKIKLSSPEEHFKVEEDNLEDKMREVIKRHKNIKDAPIVESFALKNIIAISGAYEYIKNYMDALILQMVAFHSYYDLKLIILTDEDKKDGWEYLKKMPHLFRDDKKMRFFATNFDEGKEVTAYLHQILNKRLDKFKKNKQNDEIKEDSYKEFPTYYMIITDDYKNIKDYPFIEDLLKVDGNLGFSLVILQQTLANLPTKCKSFIGINSYQEGGIFESELRKDTQRTFRIEPLENVDLNLCSLCLSNIPIENKNETYTLPKSLGFLEMYDVGNVEQLNALERWKVNDPINTLETPIGFSSNGNIFKIDFHEKEQGPHGLIAGMTGSGKSEFIITFVLSMAINYHPLEVQFLLIDYKGGGLVGAFLNKEAKIKLPHLAGTITNLDKADIDRALSSIESELKRRQTLFNQAREKLKEGTIDIYKYQKYYREGLLDEAMSHLFIICDEFAELKSDQPDFMNQLISTARIGRSLGVHLILCTQKPSGVVNDQIWSNSRLRICLKVQDSSDSNEVIKRPDAASLKDVGRFYLQVGYNEFFALGQAAYAGGPYIPQDKVVHLVDDKINFVNNILKNIKVIESPRNENLKIEGEELPQIVKYLTSLAQKENIKIRQLWKEKLPSFLTINEVIKEYQFHKNNFELNALIGVYDNPKAQTQGLFTLDLTHGGNAVIYNTDSNNMIINTIIYSLITTYHTKELNMYILDFDSQTLKVYKQAPQVGDVIFIQEKEKIDKLFKMLNEKLEARKNLFQEFNGSYDFYIKHSNQTLPGIVLMITGYENFKENYENYDIELSKITRDGFKYGIYTIVTAISDRALRLSMRNNFQTIIPLKLASAIDYKMLLGVNCPIIPDIEGRGIALVKEEAYEFQVATICEKEKTNDYIKQTCFALNREVKEQAPIIKILPEKVTWDDISINVDIEHIPVGLEEESLEISSYNPTKSLINLINAMDNTSLITFSKELIKNIMNESSFETLVFDAKKLLNEISSSDFKTIDDKIFDPNRQKPLLIFVIGTRQYIDSAPDSIKANMPLYFEKISEKRNCFFFLIDRLDDIKSLSYEAWFKKFIANDMGIFVGRGINNSTIYNLETSFMELKAPIPSNYGYCINKGIAVKVKLLGSEEDE